MQKREKIKVEKRSVLGKKVKKLRREGVLPANIYGKDFKSSAVQLPLKKFSEVYKKVHETGLIDLEVDSQTFPVLIHNVQFNPVDYAPLHADFFKVNLKEKVTASVPVIPVGEPAAVSEKKGVPLQLLTELEIEALPEDLPEKIEINVEKLAEVDEQITVADIKVPTGITILNEPSQIIFKIGELVTREVEEAVAAEEAAAAAAAAEAAAEVTEGAVPEAEKPAEEAKPEAEKPEEEPTQEKPKE